MNKKRKAELRLLAEFANSFASYVRLTGGQAVDKRAKMAAQLFEQPPMRLIELMGNVPYDLAAILSGIVGVEGEALVAKPGYPKAEAFLAELMKSDAGIELHGKMLTCLNWAKTQPGMKPLL